MKTRYDAIIVGGGVNGGAIAFNLAKRGLKVLLLEKGLLANKASGAAAGMLGAQAELDAEGPLFHLARTSRAMFSRLSDELKMISGVDIGLMNKGMLRLSLTDREHVEHCKISKIHKQNGEAAELLTGDEARKREPALSKEIRGAMYLENDGQVEAPKLAMAFLKAASALGTVVKEYVEVHSFYFSNERITGVATNDGDFMADNVVITGGAWSEKLLKHTGIHLDTQPVKGECFSVLAETPLLSSTIFTDDCYLVPKRGGRIIVGATVLPNTFNEQVTVEGLSFLMEKAKKLVPSISQCEWESAWSGIRPHTADGLPYIGEHPAYKGLFIATGHFRNGILLSPITGEVMADLIEAKTPSIDISPFRIERCMKKGNPIQR
ncbi:glycine oxidase ThiO [Planococcus sp. SIMBA_160]